jgi:hypothetical protein
VWLELVVAVAGCCWTVYPHKHHIIARRIADKPCSWDDRSPDESRDSVTMHSGRIYSLMIP